MRPFLAMGSTISDHLPPLLSILSADFTHGHKMAACCSQSNNIPYSCPDEAMGNWCLYWYFHWKSWDLLWLDQPETHSNRAIGSLNGYSPMLHSWCYSHVEQSFWHHGSLDQGAPEVRKKRGVGAQKSAADSWERREVWISRGCTSGIYIESFSHLKIRTLEL